jgi:P27 family predicted phage terminase small subunit
MRGRRPKPTALKKLQGNPGKRKLNPDEPAPPAGIPECPDYLDVLARREWKRVSALLAASGILTEIDGTALAAYCQAYSHWLDAEGQVRKLGTIVKTPSGYPILNPHVVLAKQAMQQMHKFLVEFGMTPSSRSRLRIEKPAPEDPLDAFLKRAPKPSATIQ